MIICEDPYIAGPALPAVSPMDLDGTWCVAQVRGLYERRLAASLRELDIASYVPIDRVWVTDRATGKRRRRERVLFPSYLFACCRDEGERYSVASLPNVCKLIAVRDQPRFRREITSVFIATENGLTRERFPELQPGVRGRILTGPLRGCEGVIVRRDERDVVVLQITMLGDSVPVDVNADDIEPV